MIKQSRIDHEEVGRGEEKHDWNGVIVYRLLGGKGMSNLVCLKTIVGVRI